MIFSSTSSFTQEKSKLLGSQTSHTFQTMFSFLRRSLYFNLWFSYPFIELSLVLVRRIRFFSNGKIMGILGLESQKINQNSLRCMSVIDCTFLMTDHECVID